MDEEGTGNMLNEWFNCFFLYSFFISQGNLRNPVEWNIYKIRNIWIQEKGIGHTDKNEWGEVDGGGSGREKLYKNFKKDKKVNEIE